MTLRLLPSVLRRCTTRACVAIPRPKAVAAFRVPTRTIHQRPTTLKPPTALPHHNRLILIVSIVAATVFIGDAYYFTMIHEPTPATLTADEFRIFKLAEIIPLTHDTKLLRFKANLPLADAPGGFPAPVHVIVKDDTCQLARAYTPITFTRTHFDLVVKKYDDGSVSRFLHAKEPGDPVEMRGPLVTLPYTANAVEDIGMVAGGTGITPMYQLIKKILKDPVDTTRVSLIYANRSISDILLRHELDTFATHHPERLRVHYVVDEQPAEEDRQDTVQAGRVTQEMVDRWLPPARSTSAVLVCGPGGLIQHVAGAKPNETDQGPLGGLLKKAGYLDHQVFKF
ncbi:NADH-cytochrome b5 reductase [Thoreauomyces humboldtii]|nr:NADH-cytochrome b5 reductase [Thoreauomyces humboldtii]